MEPEQSSRTLTESSPSRAAAQFDPGEPNDPDVRVSKNESGLGDNAPGTCGTPSRPVWTKLLNWPVGSAAHRSPDKLAWLKDWFSGTRRHKGLEKGQ